MCSWLQLCNTAHPLPLRPSLSWVTAAGAYFVSWLHSYSLIQPISTEPPDKPLKTKQDKNRPHDSLAQNWWVRIAHDHLNKIHPPSTANQTLQDLAMRLSNLIPYPLHLHYSPATQVALEVKNLPANAGGVRDTSSIPGLGRSLGGGHSNPLQCSCLENPMDRGAWWATVHRVSQSRTRQKQLSTSHTHLLIPGVHQTPSLFQALR